MRYDLMLAGGFGAVSVLGLQQLTQTFVVNLKSPHPVVGNVTVGSPIPHSDVQTLVDVVVASASRNEPSLWTEAGTLETDGFSSVVLSLHGQLRGTPSGPGVIGVVLVPEDEDILRSLVEGEVHLALEAVADPVPTAGLYFSGSRTALSVAFPRYRAFLYNTTDRSASVNVFAYLTH